MTLALGRHLVWSGPDGSGGTRYLYYYDEITWVVAALALVWLAWFFVGRYRRALSLRRRTPRRTDDRLLRRVVRIKHELSWNFLRPGFSVNIHAVGVGALGGAYCIQVFVGDATRELWPGAGAGGLPPDYRGVPLVLVEAPAATFLSGAERPPASAAPWEQYPRGIRERQETIVGGISGANTNLTGQSGTIGYFCTRRSRLPRRKEVHLLSNSHVFADLRKVKADDADLIAQPSPGEPAGQRPIGALVNFAPLKFDGDLSEPNHVDAAIARLWGPHPHQPLIPFVGAVKGYVGKDDVELGEPARKFGRTTGYTEGRVFSLYLDIRIRYDRTGQTALFQNQILVEPALPKFTKFVAKGDSGALLVDARQHALGLIFAGAAQPAEARQALPDINAVLGADPAAGRPQRVEGYGVANPITEVLKRLNIELLI